MSPLESVPRQLCYSGKPRVSVPLCAEQASRAPLSPSGLQNQKATRNAKPSAGGWRGDQAAVPIQAERRVCGLAAPALSWR